METMEKEQKEKRECPVCGRVMAFERAHHSTCAHAGGKGHVTPPQWTCLCGYTKKPTTRDGLSY